MIFLSSSVKCVTSGIGGRDGRLLRDIAVVITVAVNPRAPETGLEILPNKPHLRSTGRSTICAQYHPVLSFHCIIPVVTSSSQPTLQKGGLNACDQVARQPNFVERHSHFINSAWTEKFINIIAIGQSYRVADDVIPRQSGDS